MQDPIKLKINLENTHISVFRRILIPQNVNMMQLHYIIQIAMGWEFAHLFNFVESKKWHPSIRVGLSHEELESWDNDQEEQKADEVFLKDTFFERFGGKPFWYQYDFGDDWWHKISFQKPTKKDLSLYKDKPVCVEAFGACPPEDVGGPWGYTEFLNIIQDKKHPEYKEMRVWAGISSRGKYDPEFVDLEVINQTLKAYSMSPQWKMTVDKYYNG